MTTTKGPGLYDFLIEAELQHYFTALKNDLKVQTAAQLKFVSEEDLQQLGMSKPEMRRLKKYFHKHFPQNYISKLKKMIVYKKEENGQSLMAAMLSDEVVEKPPVKVPNKHIIPADSILVNKELGTGEFGVVQQGVWTNEGERIQVAIKCLSRERMQSNPIEFLKEAAIMHGIEHEHIVRLYGVVLDTNALMLVTELAPLRSLLECLKEPSLRFSFPVLTLCDFAIQICDGMQYLENKRLIHRDLAARNILVFSKNKVKISDFGLSRALGVGKDYYQTNFNVNLKLPIAWCAPECISYLRFTSASDVWAYGVTLWEMFSYGFQPWAALTGHQILEAIDEPNFQRLEQPDCCPKEYYTLMLKCWQHDPNKRPRFADLMMLLPDYKPEQVQAVQELGPDERVKREQLVYRVGEVITVLDKQPVVGVSNCWKGVVNSGKTGLFNPAHTVAYLGNNLPSNKPGQFTRGDGKNAYSSRRSRLRPDMISCPQGDVKHTGHVGLDGAYFGDISFLGGTKMIVYKKEENGQSLMAAMLSDEVVEKPPVKVPNKHIIPADSILVNKELGTGEFGVVQQGVWTNEGERIQVAIKCLSRERMQSNPIEFLKEAAIMHGIEHEHIVRIYGVVLDTNALMLVTELAPLRSLLECLKEPSLRFSFPVLTLCDFAIQICDGMQYLENKRLIHRDLAARNILVFSKNKVKISDFGLSRALGVGKDYYQTNFNVNLKLPIAWCAPECISYLRFTSASDVWAYGVTLWEMFSYGFQPWAALTGHQILEAIDEPNFQRLEQPDCCPKEYYTLMLKCWQHDPNKRPRFADLMMLLPDYKPEQVQAVQELGPDERVKREQLVYRVGEVITVLDKQPVVGVSNCWKGVVNSGKTGLFNPAHTVAYLGNNLPSNKPGQFTRGDGKNAYSSRRSRLRPDMISCPQGDVKHTGHVGLDGAYFGDISFLGGTKMIVYKKEENGQSLMAAMLSDEVVEKPPVKVPNKHIIPADSILVNKELGTGEFGVVQQGVWTNEGERIQVAIKCLSRERMQSNPIEFLKEAAIMHGIEHEHIVRIYGVVLDTNALMLVTELAPLRSLLECLKEPSLRFSFPVLTLCDFAIQICDGMQYLENKRLIHRDLAARNILVFSKNKVKISDFGLSRALGVGKDYYQTNFNVNLKLPIAWCAPECISYLRFTSASDVWAYGVTLWEMFSYGFQPWAALTGHQILEAIDEPNFQRLEQPDCCPKEYYTLMLKCWQHDPNKRPRFADLMMLLPDYKPEQVQAVQELGPDERVKREQLVYRVGEVITVLDKQPVVGVSNCWKGVVNSGKTGLFNPAHTVAYLGNNLPSNKPGQFTRGDGKNAYSSRRSRLRPDMISCPQGDVKHTGHVGLDGAYFGDISFLGGTKYDGIPHQVVTPYKPHEDTSGDLETRSCSDRAPLLHSASSNGLNCDWGENKLTTKLLTTDHEYHEISDEETSPDSPRFENPFDLGPSLLDEMDAVLRCLGGPPPPPPAPPSRPPASPPPPPSPLDDTVNKRNELREMQNTLSKAKKKQATVKPISAADQKTLDSAIAMANELAARSMNDLGGGDRPPSAPISPASPSKRKFSFRFPSAPGAHAATKQHTRTEGKTFTDEAASIPDIQECVTPEAQAAYNVLVEQPAQDTNPLRMLRSVPFVRPRVRGNKNFSTLPSSSHRQTSDPSSRCNTLPHQKEGVEGAKPDTDTDDDCASVKKEGNPVPLPPRDRNRPLVTHKPRHQRKHPLIIPSTTTLARLHHPSHSSEPTYLGLEDEPMPGGERGEREEGDSDGEGESSPSHDLAPRTPQETSGFEERIACELDALDHIEGEGAGEGEGEGVLREHVSCEDLLEFACDGPNARRTRGKTSGANSDEVRIMGKVLGNKVSEEARLAALNATDWDVHRAIKLCRLDTLLPTELCVDSVAKLTALYDSGWEVARAAGLLLATLQPQDDVAQV